MIHKLARSRVPDEDLDGYGQKQQQQQQTEGRAGTYYHADKAANSMGLVGVPCWVIRTKATQLSFSFQELFYVFARGNRK